MYSFGPNAALYVDWSASEKVGPASAIYFFKDRQYIRWNVETEQLYEGYPHDIAEGWPGLLDVFPGKSLSGAMHVPDWQNRIFFFFQGMDRVATWDVESHKLDSETRAIRDVMPSSLTEDGRFTPLYVDTGREKKVYGFRGDTYTRWMVDAGAMPLREDEGYPRKIGDGWTGGITVAPTCAVSLRWPERSKALTNRKIYFFLGDLYTRWDVETHSQNYRLDIPSGWKGWPAFE